MYYSFKLSVLALDPDCVILYFNIIHINDYYIANARRTSRINFTEVYLAHFLPYLFSPTLLTRVSFSPVLPSISFPDAYGEGATTTSIEVLATNSKASCLKTLDPEQPSERCRAPLGLTLRPVSLSCRISGEHGVSRYKHLEA